MKIKGFIDMSLFREFIDELPGVNAPKSAQNVCLGSMDFADFLLEQFGSAGSEQVKQCIKTFPNTLNRPAKEHQQAQL